MGRFESNVAHYVRNRPRYPDAFYATIAERLGLDGTGRLIDLGCGPGFIAIGLAPFVGEVIGIDPEPAMLAAARDEADRAGVALRLIEGRAEDVGDDLAPVRLATFGRSFHWMDPAATLAAMKRVIDPDGHLAFIRDRITDAPENNWHGPWENARKAFESPDDSGAVRRLSRLADRLGPALEGSPFRVDGEVSALSTRTTNVDDLVERALSMSTTSPAKLGARLDAFEAAIRAALAPFAGADGRLTEIASSDALIAVPR